MRSLRGLRNPGMGDPGTVLGWKEDLAGVLVGEAFVGSGSREDPPFTLRTSELSTPGRCRKPARPRRQSPCREHGGGHGGAPRGPGRIQRPHIGCPGAWGHAVAGRPEKTGQGGRDTGQEGQKGWQWLDGKWSRCRGDPCSACRFPCPGSPGSAQETSPTCPQSTRENAELTWHWEGLADSLRV